MNGIILSTFSRPFFRKKLWQIAKAKSKTARLGVVLAAVALLIFSNTSQAQVVVSLNPPNPIQFKSLDVWNMSVVYSNSNPVTVQFRAEIQRDGRTVERLISSNFQLVQGMNTISTLNLRTNQQLYLDPNLGGVERKLGKLPDGNYQYCVRIVCMESQAECSKKLSQELALSSCQDVAVQNTTPLLLSMPEDQSKIDEQRPTFTWIPPMPIGGDPDIRYQLTLVKLKGDQSAEDGLHRNRILHRSGFLQGVQMLFPPQLEDLEKGSRYAWRVQAFLGRTFLTTSEVWEFEIKKEKDPGESYVRVRFNDPKIHTCASTLRFIYQEEYTPGLLTYKILDNTGKEVKSDEEYSTEIGENKFELDLNEKGLVSDEQYVLEITDRKGRLLKLKFKYTEEADE